METRIKGYNYQPNNVNFGKKISGWIQCFATSDWMFLSYLTNGFYDVNDDVGLARFLETLLTGGKDENGDTLPMPTDTSSMFFWSKNYEMIKKYLVIAGCDKEVKYTGDAGISFDEVYALLRDRPMIIGTDKIGGLPGGHIVVADHITPEGDISVKDSAGNANTNYRSGSGDGVIYSLEMCKAHFGRNGQIHSIYEV